jgi:hypothetical protein
LAQWEAKIKEKPSLCEGASGMAVRKGQRSCCLVNDGRVLQLLNLVPREKHRHPEALWQLMNVRPPKGVLLGSLSQQFQP